MAKTREAIMAEQLPDDSQLSHNGNGYKNGNGKTNGNGGENGYSEQNMMKLWPAMPIRLQW